MSAILSSPTRRNFLAALATAGAFGFVLFAAISLFPAKLHPATEDNPFRPFHTNIPEEALVDLRQRVLATPWPDRETVTDQFQ